jgi:hypothetical protein
MGVAVADKNPYDYLKNKVKNKRSNREILRELEPPNGTYGRRLIDENPNKVRIQPQGYPNNKMARGESYLDPYVGSANATKRNDDFKMLPAHRSKDWREDSLNLEFPNTPRYEALKKQMRNMFNNLSTSTGKPMTDADLYDIVEVGKGAPASFINSNRLDNDAVRGLYVPPNTDNVRRIYYKNAKGINGEEQENNTIKHELFHAATGLGDDVDISFPEGRFGNTRERKDPLIPYTSQNRYIQAAGLSDTDPEYEKKLNHIKDVGDYDTAFSIQANKVDDESDAQGFWGRPEHRPSDYVDTDFMHKKIRADKQAERDRKIKEYYKRHERKIE